MISSIVFTQSIVNQTGMSTNQILAGISLILLLTCLILSLIVLLGKPSKKLLTILSAGALFSMVAVTVLSIVLTL